MIEPATPCVGGWHLDAVCDHLEAVTRGAIRNLVILIPPRHTKSILTSVCWPVWDWIAHPAHRFLFASYSAGLSTEHAVLSRRILDSPWYQARWGKRFRLTTDQNVKTHYENTKRGVRISTSVGGTVTGLRLTTRMIYKEIDGGELRVRRFGLRGTIRIPIAEARRYAGEAPYPPATPAPRERHPPSNRT